MKYGTCTVDGCERKHLGRGFCTAHYSRWRKTGDAGSAEIAPRDYRPHKQSMKHSACTVAGCERKSRARGYCPAHYQRWKNHRDVGTSLIIPHSSDPYERFRTYTDTSDGPDACHPWKGYRQDPGYGKFAPGPNQKSQIASRWLLGYLRGRPLEWGEFACHHCDNPPCVNPRHLYVGTATDNALDAVERGRHRSPNREKTHCKRGHEFTESNTRTNARGHRWCRTCGQIYAEKYNRQRRKARQ